MSVESPTARKLAQGRNNDVEPMAHHTESRCGVDEEGLYCYLIERTATGLSPSTLIETFEAEFHALPEEFKAAFHRRFARMHGQGPKDELHWTALVDLFVRQYGSRYHGQALRAAEIARSEAASGGDTDGILHRVTGLVR